MPVGAGLSRLSMVAPGRGSRKRCGLRGGERAGDGAVLPGVITWGKGSPEPELEELLADATAG